MQTRDECSKNFCVEPHSPLGERLAVHSPGDEALEPRFPQKRHQESFRFVGRVGPFDAPSPVHDLLRSKGQRTLPGFEPTAPIDRWHEGYPDRGPFRSAA
jgi:hypothetical protein